MYMPSCSVESGSKFLLDQFLRGALTLKVQSTFDLSFIKNDKITDAILFLRLYLFAILFLRFDLFSKYHYKIESYQCKTSLNRTKWENPQVRIDFWNTNVTLVVNHFLMPIV